MTATNPADLAPEPAPLPLAARNADFPDLYRILTQQQDAKADAVVPAQAVRSIGGVLHVDGMGATGLPGDPGIFRPTEAADADLAEKLHIDLRYLRRLRDSRIDLYDANVNGWLHGCENPAYEPAGPDGRRFLVRTFRSPDLFGEGVARAVLSDSYKRIDNLDVLATLMSAITELGLHVNPAGTNLSEQRMVVNIDCPEIAMAAPRLLDGYRPPQRGDRPPQVGDIVSAGLFCSNSETGDGAFIIGPRIMVLACTNGMQRPAHNLKMVHLGGKLDDGLVRWSDATQERNLELMRSRTIDAVRLFLSEDYLRAVVEDAEAIAVTRLIHPGEAVQRVGTALSYSQEQIKGIMDFFVTGGQPTAGGVLQAITAYAQTVPDPDEAYDLEASAWQAMETAAALR